MERRVLKFYCTMTDAVYFCLVFDCSSYTSNYSALIAIFALIVEDARILYHLHDWIYP